MKTQTVTDTSVEVASFEDLAPLPRFDLSFVLVATFTGLSLLFILAQILQLIEISQISPISDGLLALVSLTSVFAVWRILRNPLLDDETKKAWKIILFSFVFYSIGHNTWFYYSSILGIEPFPSLADAGFWMFYPLMFWGLLSFPTNKKETTDKVKFGLDVAIVMLGGALAVWYFIIQPTIDGIAEGEWLTKGLNLFYTVGDMVLMLGIATILMRRPLEIVKKPIYVLIVGLLLIWASDIGFAYFTLQNTYFSGHWIDNLFVYGMLVMASAAVYQNHLIYKNELLNEEVKADVSAPKFSWLPYLGVATGFAILLWETKPYWFDWLGVVVFVTLSMTSLVLFRQIIAVKENIRLVGEQAAHQEALRFRTLVENSSDLITIWDRRGNLIFRSPSVKKLLGYEVEEIAALSKSYLIHPDDLDEIDSLFSAVCEGKIDSYQKEIRMLHKDGKYRVLESITSRLPESGHNPGDILTNTRDITQRKNDEETLKLYTAKIEQSNRELQDFAYVASHDLQEPLRKVQAFGDRLDTKFAQDLGVEGQDYLKRMRDAAGRMQILINDLLSFSRISTKGTPFVQTDLEKICREVIVDLEISIEEKQAKVEVFDMLTIDADPLQMRQLFQNLIGNAIKFRRKDTPPNVKIYSIVDELAINAKGDANNVCKIIIEDNGIGFDEKYLDRIFTVFQRLHGRGEYEGSGVGLAVCRKIVERHSGQITAQSVPDEGTKFIITLPVKNKVGVITNE
jgi:PAS domain S-box-containing protein